MTKQKNRFNLVVSLVAISINISLASMFSPVSARAHENTREKSLTVLSYNVLEGLQGSEVQKNVFVEWVLKLNPDIALLQELNGFTEKDLGDLARRYGHPYAVRMHEAGYRVGITSKYPLQNVQRVSKNQNLGYIYAQVEDWHVFSVHLDPFKEDTRLRELELILAHASTLPADAKVMCIGDFNSLAASDSANYAVPNFEKNYQLRSPEAKIEYRVTDAIIKAGFTDALSMFPAKFKPSFPSVKRIVPGDAGVRIDYAFLNAPLAKHCIGAEIVYDPITRFLSDHYPLVVRFDTNR